MMKKRLLLVAGLSLAAPVAFTPAFAQGFSDNELSYHYQPFSREPAVADSQHPRGLDIPKNILDFTHVDGGNIISNFLNIEILKSNHDDPANNSTEGAVEVYSVYRGDVSSKFLTGNTLAWGPVRDVTFQFGGDINTKNTAFAPQKDLLVFGPNIHFDTDGFVNLAFHFDKEWNNNGIVSKSVSFHPTLEMELVYMQPVPVFGLPLRFEGFTNLVLPKGKDGFGDNTVTELLSHNQLTLDFGQVINYKPHVIDAFVGFQYWINKFGNAYGKTPGALEITPFFGRGRALLIQGRERNPTPPASLT